MRWHKVPELLERLWPQASSLTTCPITGLFSDTCVFLLSLMICLCVPFLAGQPSADVLKYTYEDFKKGASDTYVTYLIRIEEKGRSPGLSEVLKYEIDVGNQSTTLGYYNGRLEPLGSYR